MNLKNTETEKNLYRALTGEALAHIKYQFYKSKLSNDYKEYETIFDEIIHNEKEHAKIWFKILHDGMPSNEDNLMDAFEGESFECNDMYPTFAKIAEEEGFTDIARLFRSVAEIECRHSTEFERIIDDLSEDVFKSDSNDTGWKCLNCGHVVYSSDAPSVCPVCEHPQKYFTRILG